MSDLSDLTALFDIDDDARREFRDALAPVPRSACMRAVFAWPLRPIVAKQGEDFVARYVELERRLTMVRNPFAWVPLTDFILRWTYAGHLAFPELDLETAATRLVESNVAILSNVPTVKTLLLAAGNDLRGYLTNGIESVSLFQNFGENLLMDHGPRWVESVSKRTFFPAFRYIQTCYNAGVFELFGVNGRTIYFDETPTSFAMRLEWEEPG